MPELPEVETIKSDLDQVLIGQIINRVTVLSAKTVTPLRPATFKKKLFGRQIITLDRRAKILIVGFETRDYVVIHLKMTGQLIYHPPSGQPIFGGHPQPGGLDNLPNKFTRVYFEFTDGSRLYFNDMRKFGWVRYVTDPNQETSLAQSGLEPLSRQFTTARLKAFLQRFPRRPIKQLLLDQTLIAGLGNIYTDESLFAAGLDPRRPAGKLTDTEIGKLYQAIKRILRLAVKKKGTSFSDYIRATGQPGGFVPYLKVYDRAGQPCKSCRQLIAKTVVGGRGTHYCPRCQK